MRIDESARREMKRLTTYMNSLAERVSKIPKDDLGWKRIKPYDDKELREKIEAIKPYDDTEIKQKLAELEEVLKPLPELKDAVEQQKKDFDDLLAKADLNIEEVKKELEAEKAKNTELAEKKLKETQNLSEKLEGLKTTVDNALDKQKGTFKGVAQKPEIKEAKKKNPDLAYKPGGA